MEASQPEDIFVQQIPVKRLQVSNVEDDPVPLWNGSIVQSLRLHDLKQSVALLPGIRDSVEQRFPHRGFSLHGRHSSLRKDRVIRSPNGVAKYEVVSHCAATYPTRRLR